MKIYRAMIPDTDRLLQVGRSARQLGVRTRDRLPHNDVRAATPADIVNPGEGMSAAPNDPANLGKNRRPPQLNGGTGKDPVWEIDTGDLGPKLQYIQDTPAHGFVGPNEPMTLEELEQALAATRALWVRVIG
ncbi:MAG: hypothetical protein AAB289_11070 [Chloroflexota bacterium]|mgnify:CR=1 FL=1